MMLARNFYWQIIQMYLQKNWHSNCLPESMCGKFEDFIHTFLIRDPEWVIYSNYKAILKDCVGDATLDPSEVGFIELYKLHNFVKEKKGINLIVVNAINLQTHHAS